MPITIRPARPEDAAALSGLMDRAIRHNNAVDYPPRVIARIRLRHTPTEVAAMIATRRVFVAEERGRVLGSVALEGHAMRGLFVVVERQGQGIALALMRHAEDLAIAEGIAELSLQSSLTAHALYERLGYRKQAFRFHPEGSTYRMIKRIAPGGSPST